MHAWCACSIPTNRPTRNCLLHARLDVGKTMPALPRRYRIRDEEVLEQELLTAEQVAALKAGGYRPRAGYEQNPTLREVLDFIARGALADGDIGSHFPPSDPQWKGAASDKFLKYAVERVTARGGRIANLEVTMICERPKIGPLRDTMRARIAEITGLNISRVAVKATTNEKLGSIGRSEGIAAFAVATIRRS